MAVRTAVSIDTGDWNFQQQGWIFDARLRYQRPLMGEALKLRELEYVQAARAFGVGHFRILIRHVLPNVMHIVLISIVLDFSGLVLAEAVLSYISIGVDPATNSRATGTDSPVFSPGPRALKEITNEQIFTIV